MPTDASSSDRRARLLLALGAAAGLAIAAASLLAGSARPPAPEGVAALVNGTPIREASYRRLLAAVESDRRTPLTEADRRHVLDRLIEEELLVQHAVDLGLVHTDRRVRGDLVSAVLSGLTAAADGFEPDDPALREFFAENGDYFARPARLWVRQVYVARSADGDAASGRARSVAARLRAGEEIADVREALGDPVLAPLPDAPLPPAKLREYLGPSAVEVALALDPGGVSDPVATPQGYHVLALVERVPGAVPPLDDVRDQVAAEMRRREGDRLLRERLDALRAAADVRIDPQLETGR